MPELPEVETVCRGLAMSLPGERVSKVMLHAAGLRVPFTAGLVQMLTGRRFSAVTRRAKYILLHLDNSDILLAHLGMSGKILVHENAPPALAKHDHVVVECASGKVVIFNDPRRFGVLLYVRHHEIAHHPMLVALGPEPLEKPFSAEYLRRRMQGKKTPIKPFLMDQSLVVGVGNIYASEALFLAGIMPDRPAASAQTDAALLVRSIRKVLNAAIVSGGSTLRDYVRSSGDVGYFQHQFNVYGREGKPCTRCDGTIKRSVQAGRSSFYCAGCQS